MTIRKKLVCFSVIRSSTSMKSNIAKYETMPFDGMIFSAAFSMVQTATTQSLHNWIHSGYAVSWAELATALTDYQTTPFRRFSENYLLMRMHVATPYPVIDWFSPEMRAVIWNIRQAAKFVKMSGCRGLFYDPEPDNTAGRKLFNYSDRPLAASKTFAQYKAQVRICGQLIMEAILEENPDIRLGMSFIYDQCPSDNAVGVESDNYGLFKSFLDGMYSVIPSSSRMKIIDFYEAGYNHKFGSQLTADLALQATRPSDVDLFDTYRLHTLHGIAASTALLDDAGLAIALPQNISTVSEDTAFVYTETQVAFDSSGGTPTVPASTITTIRNARISTGLEASFDPSSIPGLIADFNPLTMGLANDAPITSYTDSTGLVYTQSGANRPLFKVDGIATGKAGVDFTAASSQSLVMDGIIARLTGNADFPFTVVMVYKLKTNSVTYGFFGLGRDATTDSRITLIANSTNVLQLAGTDDAAASMSIVAATGTLDTSAAIATWATSGLEANMRKNGTNVIATNQYADANIGTLTLNRARLGASARNTPNIFIDAVIGRTLIYNTILGLDTIRWLELGLAEAYGLQTAGA